MSLDEIRSERRGASLIITFNRPDHANSMTLDMATQLHNLLKQVTTDKSIRAVLLQGAGDHFMDGMDMNFYAGDLTRALDQANKLILPYHSAIRELQAMEKPVLSAVKGRVTGAGLSFMLASDLVIAAENTVLCSKFADYAMTPDGGCSYFLPRKIGACRASEMLMLNEEISSTAAARLHLVNRVVGDDELLPAALEWIDRLSEGPTKSYGAIKKLIMRSFEQDLNGQLGLEHSYFGASTRTFDFREAVKAFAAKHTPKFTGS